MEFLKAEWNAARTDRAFSVRRELVLGEPRQNCMMSSLSFRLRRSECTEWRTVGLASTRIADDDHLEQKVVLRSRGHMRDKSREEKGEMG